LFVMTALRGRLNGPERSAACIDHGWLGKRDRERSSGKNRPRTASTDAS
jgi:hypothetical protein